MIKRHIIALIRQSLQDFPAVLLNGARQAGKSTVAQQLIEEGLFDHYITMDDLLTLEAATTDPDGFLSQYSGRIVIDEVQRVPNLLLAIKKKIDSTPQPGRYLLTGSANILSYPNVAESLAGRIDIISLEGLSFGELNNRKSHSTLIEDLLSDNPMSVLLNRWRNSTTEISPLTVESLYESIFFGGLPRTALKHSLSFTERWYSAYFKAYVEKDVRDLSRLLEIVSFSKLFRLASLTTGNLLNVKNLGMDAGIDQRTAARYIEILNMTFQLHLLNPWHGNIQKRLIKTAKVYVNDSGFACFLAGVHNPKALSSHHLVGQLAETWLWAELRKLLVYIPSVQSGFYRTHQGKEVDFVLFRGEQRIGIECKLSQSVSKKDFDGLKDMQEAMGGECKGIILYAGSEVIPFTHNLAALPLSVLL